MDFTWAFQLAVAIGSVLVDRQLELDPEREMSGIFASQFNSSTFNNTQDRRRTREARMVAVPPGAPITIGTIMQIPVSLFFPFIRRRLIDVGKEGHSSSPLLDNDVDETSSQTEETFYYDDDDDDETNDEMSTGAHSHSTTPDVASATQREFPVLADGDDSPAFSGSDITEEGSTSDGGDSSSKTARSFFPGRNFHQVPTPEWNSAFEEDEEEQLTLLDSYFSLLGVDSERCKRKFICQMAADPDEYYPLSDIFLTRLKPRRPRSKPVLGRFRQLAAAAQAGFNDVIIGRGHHGTARPRCDALSLAAATSTASGLKETARACKLALEDVINMGRLGLLKEIGRKFNVAFEEYSVA